MRDLTRKFDIEYLYKMRGEAPTQVERDVIDKKIYKILNEHPKIGALRGQLVNAMRRGNGKEVGKISGHIKYIQSSLEQRNAYE